MGRTPKRKSGHSTAYLDSLWSKAVKTYYNGRCGLCKREADESHHIVHRGANWALRWDINNGIALCKKCHSEADKLENRKIISEVVAYDYLMEREKKYKFKADLLMSLNLSEAEYKAELVKELTEIIKGS